MPHIQLLDSHDQDTGPRLTPNCVVLNTETGKLLVSHLRYADTFWLRLAGLIPTGNLPKGHGLLLTPCTSIHTFLMKYPIDVACLDSDFVVIRVFPNVKPWRILPAVAGTRHVLEVPRATLADSGTLVGHRLQVLPGIDTA